MLLQFSVKNFRSFKDEVKLSLEASSDEALKSNFTNVGRESLLNAAVIFGANASGKSNIFKAIAAAILIIRQSNSRQINQPLELIIPFLFDTETVQQPTSFEFYFYAEGVKYLYGFSATRKEIIEEYLYLYKTAKPSVIFERKENNKYRFTDAAIKRELQPIIERNTPNKLFLATATAWNCESTRTPYLWFGEKINVYDHNTDQLFGIAAKMYDSDSNDSLRQFTNALLHEADINIDNYIFKTDSFKVDEMEQQLRNAIVHGLRAVIPIMPEQLQEGKTVQIEAIHTFKQKDELKNYSLPMSEESLGTQHLFMISPILKHAFETGETICIDEFDSSLHPLLAIYLIKLFSNPQVNRAHAQLIISAHMTELLSPDVLRRDQIYFTEKQRETGSSELYSLDEFSVRSGENMRKAYLLGRYGAVPDIPEEALLS